MTTIELVRHAKAQSRDRWWGKPDRKRPLTASGHEQARSLARELLAAGPVDALWSSPYLRCVQTLEPLAAKTGLPIQVDEALAETATLPVVDGGDAWVAAAWLGGRAVAFVNRLCDAHPTGRVVACSHGDIVPALMALLVGRDGLDLTDVRLKKGGRFTLQFEGRRCVGATISAAPAT
ncbi:MAG TPA: phosphoglycerate mutase family protein [Egibacteraceae bacterium]